MYPEEDPYHGQSVPGLLSLAKRSRKEGNPRRANFALQGLLQLLRTGERFSEISVHDLDAELSSSGCYEASMRQYGLRATERLLFDLSCSRDLKRLAIQNSFLYLNQFPWKEKHELEFERPIIPESSLRFRPTNPSIVRVQNGYQVICRTVNYVCDGAVWYESLAKDGVIRTRNFFLTLTRKLKVVRSQEIVDRTARRTFLTGIEGFEDCRLFVRNRTGALEYAFTCNVSDAQSVWSPQMALAQIPNANHEGKELIVRGMVLLRGPSVNRSEKNWLPFEYDKELHVIYGFDPVIILRPDEETGVCHLVHQSERVYDCSRFRGGAAPIAFDGGYLAIVHEVINQSYRRYAHRFVWMDSSFLVQKVTAPFYFLHPTIEFCAGLCPAHEENDVIASVGVEDSQAFLFRLDTEAIRSQLAPCPQSDWLHVLGGLGNS